MPISIGDYDYWSQNWCCTSSTSMTATWISWNTTSTTATAWQSWTGNGTITTISQNGVGVRVAPPPPETEEQRVAREERNEASRQRAIHLRDQAEVAKVRAAELLRSILTEQQWDQWVADSAFDVVTESGHTYRINRGIAGNVDRIENGLAVERLCIHPRTSIYDDDRQYLGDMPMEDVLITQKLNLEADEEEFRKIANITVLRRPPRDADDYAVRNLAA